VADLPTIDSESSLEAARKLFADGSPEKSVALIKTYWLQNPNDGKAPLLLAEILKDAGKGELSKCLATLAEKMSNQDGGKTPGAQELFEAGFALIDIRQYELAAMLLNRSAKLIPGEPTIHYELGFALMSLKRFAEATPHFELVAAKAADFDTLLNLAACYTMLRRQQKAQALIAKIEQLGLDEEQSLEVNHRKMVLRRLATVTDKALLSTRDWLYVLYGSILLREDSRDSIIKEDTTSIGSMLAVLKGVLEGLRFEPPEVIEFYGPQSRPLSQALSELLEIPNSSYQGPDRPERVLLTMTWASDIIGPHKSFTRIEERRSIFAYSMTWQEPLPLVPEIIGCMGYDEPMPWHQSGSKQGSADDADLLRQDQFDQQTEATYRAILANARDLEADPRIIHTVQAALDYYGDKQGLLLLGNSTTIPYRSEYTAELI
jgi:tetratricopeptide (TPR) repeat protein